MQDIQSIIPVNNNSSQPQTIQEPSTVISFHDRAALVARDILKQLGIDENKIRMASQATSTIAMLPPFIPGAVQAQNMIKDIEPLLLALQDNIDPGSYLKQIPEEKIMYFLNQVITRLEWIKYGNNAPETGSQEQQASNNKTADSNA